MKKIEDIDKQMKKKIPFKVWDQPLPKGKAKPVSKRDIAKYKKIVRGIGEIECALATLAEADRLPVLGAPLFWAYCELCKGVHVFINRNDKCFKYFFKTK